MAKLLSYNQRIFEPWFKNPFNLDFVNYRIVEGLEEFWGLEADIPEVVYEHAILQNVDFEWGTWGRAVRSEFLDDWLLSSASPPSKLQANNQRILI